VRGRLPEQARLDFARLPRMRIGGANGQNIAYPTTRLSSGAAAERINRASVGSPVQAFSTCSDLPCDARHCISRGCLKGGNGMRNIAVMLVFAAGCASVHYTHPSKGEAELRHDDYYCEKTSEQSAANQGSPGNVFMIALEHQRCMQAEGWVARRE
jgi:hypothetical protein